MHIYKNIGRFELIGLADSNLSGKRPMRCQFTTGLDHDALARRVIEIFHSRGEDFSRHRLAIKEQVILTMELLRNNLSQIFLADLLDISQPTTSRIYRRMLLVIDEALTFTGISFEEAASDGRVILIDGT